VRFEVTVGKPAAGGGFVGRSPEGLVVFVRHAAPGERVMAEVTEENKSFLRADAVEILEPSPSRIEPRCVVAGPGGCGGCDYQHLSLELQRKLKAQLIEEHLSRIAKIDHSVVVEPASTDDDGYNWRTRVRFGIDELGLASFHAHRSSELVAITDCPVAVEEVRSTGVMTNRFDGVEELEVFGHPNGTTPVVNLTTTPRGFSHTPEIEGAGIVVDGTILQPPGRVKVTIGARSFDVGVDSFFQSHRSAADVLTRAVLQAAKLSKGDHVADLYCGVGLFSAALGARVGTDGKVVAIEKNAAATADARRNCKDLGQVTILTESVNAKTVASMLPGTDVVVMDPARDGVGKATMVALCNLTPRPKRVVYVSCDPATFARDVATAMEEGWKLTSLRAFDLFPNTEHVEVLGVLEPQAR
jgi:tRNA/tmRNA/rRNA uracil-C5-methylase (TrmA/RlmC/RlmD family)